ncbi:MAG: response regulator, partial [Verrucomicrobia bacterium]|nr:response regulator [Verrucomicrobiota bacterium]
VDRDMYEKIVLNLLSNAFKFTLEGEIEACLRDAGRGVELSVRDTGAGIAKDQLPHIFERFHRVEGVPARTHEGTGIGLALVQELAKLHGGSVRVRSELGQGSTFTLTLPKGTSHLPGDRIGAPSALPLTPMAADDYLGEALSWVDHETDQLPIFDPKLQGNSLGTLPVDIVRPRIVWADDNADMRNYVVRLLTRSYSVEACSDGETALAAVRREFPDLVLADVMMPRLDGFGLVRELRAIEQTREIPVILLSARAGEEARVEGLRAGADDYLVKPFSGGELLGRVEAHLKLARVRRDSATALRHRAEQFETLFNVAPLGVYVVDADFRIAQVNPIARPFFGDLPGGVLGRDFDQIIHMVWDQDYADELVQIFRQTLASGDSCVAPERAEFRIDRNAIEYYEWRVDRITLPDGKFGVVCYFRDISEQIRVRMLIEQSRDALREADRRKDEFLATLAHELRNPLAPIRNSIFILRSITSERAESLLEMMERQVSQMVRLVDDLMEVSRITTGKIKLLKERMELKGIVQSAIETSTPVIDAARHRLSVSLPIEELMLEGDPVRLAQVLSNLLNNAAKYTEEGGQIWLAAQREGSNVVISVRDNGIGIPGEMIPKIFDLFAQVDRSHSRDQGGLGIGLTLARSLIEMHGGTIQARSDGPDQGSEFVLRLPLVTEPSGTIPHRAWDESLGLVRPRCMFVVDDNRDSADTLAMLLKFQGAEAYTANDGPTALEALHKYRPSIVLLDIGLPGMDGFEVAQRIRELKEYRDTILVALTGWGQEEDREKSKAAGIDYHLVKPDDLRTLQDLMASMPEEQPRAVTTSL